jgi:ATP-binding cassette, subfamily B (MDR/TAP), member 1
MMIPWHVSEDELCSWNVPGMCSGVAQKRLGAHFAQYHSTNSVLIQLIDTFTRGGGALGSNRLEKEVSKISFWFMVLAGVTMVASFFEVALFMWSGSRQVARLRQRYLAASLNQEQEYYDTQATSGDILSGLNQDCHAVQNAISEKVGNTIHHVGTFVVSVGISLYRGWELALVMFALMPLIAGAGAVIAKLMTAGASIMANGYAKANVSSTQAVANIRTVASFQAEEKSLETYSNLLEEPRRTQTKLSTYAGMAGGFVNCAVFITCALAHLFGICMPWLCIAS